MLDINYNRSDRQYEWVDPDSGEIFTFPRGKQGKVEAFHFAISMLDPELYQAAQRLIEQHPQLERVTWKAVELVCGEAVEVFDVPQGNVQAMMDSSDGYGRYAITTTDGYYECQCEHWKSLAAPLTEQGNRYCKHILAMYLWRVTREERF
jgi:hypothetical protein